jgi:DNA-binding transcriptional ArsR family regulator
MSEHLAPPHDIEAEQSVLGAVLLTDVVLTAVIADGLRPEHFYRPEHGTVFAAMCALHAAGAGVDRLTVVDQLRSEGTLERVGGQVGVEALTGPVPNAGYARRYAKTVMDLASDRALAQLARQVEAEPRDLAARHALREALGERTSTDRRLRLLTTQDLAELPPPSWLLGDLLPAGGFSVLYGPSGKGKSFLALDWSMCIAAGLPWYGKSAAVGDVVFIAAEGVHGLHRRVAAWTGARQQANSPTRIHFLPEALNLLERDDVTAAQQLVAALPEPPSLIVVDTMARTMVGGDENSARDVGLFIANVDALRQPSGAAALVIHHTGKSGDDERGSSALRGAADMMWSLKPEDASLRLRNEKAKDSEPPDPWLLHLETVAESCVIRLGSNDDALSPHERAILQTLPESFGSDPAPAGKLLKASDVPERSYYRALQSLERRGFVDAQQSGRSKLYAITDTGRQALLPTTANHCQDAVPITAATSGSLGPHGGSNTGREAA